jgi:hypothetical protein
VHRRRLIKRKVVSGVLLAPLLSALTVYADQVKVNIVYPIRGATYPIIDPAPGGLKSAFATARFGVTCKGGPYPVQRGCDGATVLVSSNFYDQTSV